MPCVWLFQKIVYKKSIIELIHLYSNLYGYYVLRILKICVILVFFLWNLLILDEILLWAPECYP